MRTACPLCGAPGDDAGAKSGSRRTRAYRLAACARCGLAWVTDPDTDYDAIYDEAYYRGEGADTLVDYVDELTDPRTVRRYEWEGLLEIARDLGVPSGVPWIDFGGGAGGFARFLNEHAYDARAYDTGAGIELGRRSGVPIASDADLDAADGTIAVVSAIEVAEHVVEFDAMFARIARLLRPGGLLMLTTGNLERAPGRLADWGYVMPEVHVTFFSPRSLATAYRRAGLEPIDVRHARGWDQVLRYKILKTLGVHHDGGIERIVPWRIAAALADRVRGVSVMPFARKPG